MIKGHNENLKNTLQKQVNNIPFGSIFEFVLNPGSVIQELFIMDNGNSPFFFLKN